MTKEQEALDNFLKEYLFLCEKLNTNMQEKMLLDSNSPYNILKNAFEKAPEPIQTGIDLGVIKPKKYLKWEDLETGISRYGLLNGIKIQIDLFPPHSTDNHEWEVRLIKDNGCWFYIKEQDREFFDDLHLEEVE